VYTSSCCQNQSKSRRRLQASTTPSPNSSQHTSAVRQHTLLQASTTPFRRMETATASCANRQNDLKSFTLRHEGEEKWDSVPNMKTAKWDVVHNSRNRLKNRNPMGLFFPQSAVPKKLDNFYTIKRCMCNCFKNRK
jgi:hypothetical protein